MKSELALFGGVPAVTVPVPRRWPWVSESAKKNVNKLLESGSIYDFARGPIFTQLEETIADYYNVRYVLSVSSGTAALHSAYVAIGVGPEDEVIVPTYTFHATVTPLFLCGAIPVLCDSNPETGNINVEEIKRKITYRTKAIVVTHLFGHPAEMDEIMLLAEKYNLKVVEDCSHGIGARYHGKLVGTIGHVGIFSMGAAKMVSGGMGGVLITNDQEIYDRAIVLGHCHERAKESQLEEKYHGIAALGYGANYRITPISAVICADHFLSLDKRIESKTCVLNRLSEHISEIPGLSPPKTAPNMTRGGWYGYKVSYNSQELDGLSLDLFIEAIRAEGLEVKRPTTMPLHLKDSFQKSDLYLPLYTSNRLRPLYQSGDLPRAEALYFSFISFPESLFHQPCDDFLEEYLLGLRKVVDSRGELMAKGVPSTERTNFSG